MIKPHRLHFTRLSKRARPIPKGNQKTAASTPAMHTSRALLVMDKLVSNWEAHPLAQSEFEVHAIQLASKSFLDGPEEVKKRHVVS